MTTLVGRATRLEIGNLGAYVPVQALTRTSPAQCTAAAHGLATGALVLWWVRRGALALHGMLTRVVVIDANTVALPDVDASRFAGWSQGGFYPVSAWSTLTEATGYRFGQSRSSTLDVSKYFDTVERLGFSAPKNQFVEVSRLPPRVRGETAQRIAAAGLRHDPLPWRIISADGSARFFAGVPSDSEEALSVGALGTGGFSIAVIGRIGFSGASYVAPPPPPPPPMLNIFSFEISPENVFEMEI